MTAAKVMSVRAVDLDVIDVTAAARFFTSVWHLEVAGECNGTVYLHGSGSNRHILSLKPADRPAIVRVVLGTSGRAAVDALYDSVRAHGGVDVRPPRTLPWPGGGYGFGCKDPEGRNLAVVADVEDRGDGPIRPDRPAKISHVNLNSAAPDASHAFLRDALGFRMTDQTTRMRFLQCGSDHHSLVLCNAAAPTLNHIAFEMPDLDSLMRGIGRLRDHGYPIEWGPGRHGPGNNAFGYFVGPEGLPIEYTTEMQQCDEGYVGRPPEQWTWPPGRLDHWGLMSAPSARFEQAQALFAFTRDGHRC